MNRVRRHPASESRKASQLGGGERRRGCEGREDRTWRNHVDQKMSTTDGCWELLGGRGHA